ncbi:hypothetical protein [Beijerinckia sp. L45]|uniref:beta strand repeat-containing protein n=1 Tax=Beijerinckia sp. L45 TaxID=1641855 RepID=UPI00131C2242|nr:hypothetical protein [Beijerinckia sp. L45]
MASIWTPAAAGNLASILNLTALASQNPAAVAITGGTLSNVSISATSITASGNQTIGGTLSVTGNTTLNGYATLTGEYISTGSNAAYNVVDRSGAASGNGTFYRSGGINYLWDNTGGNVAGWDSTTFHAYGNASVLGTLGVSGTATFTGPVIANSSLQIAGAGTNLLEAGTGDGSSFSTYNVNLQLWQSLAISTYDGSVHGRYDARSGFWDCLGGFYVNGTAAIDGGRNANLATVNASGNINTSGGLNVQNTLDVTGNQVYTTNNATLYLNYNSSGGIQLGSGTLSTNGNISSANAITASGGTGFVSYTSSGVALQMGSNSAIRDVTNGGSTMYFDVSVGGGTYGAFNWRSTNGYTSLMTLTSSGLTTPQSIGASGNVTAGNIIQVAGNASMNSNQVYTNSGPLYLNYGGAVQLCNTGGQAYFGGTINCNGEIQTTSANSYRSVYGNYASFWRQDGGNLYLMLTNSGDQYGSWNGLRPFMVGVSNGYVQMLNGVEISDTLTVDNVNVSGAIGLTGRLNQTNTGVDGGLYLSNTSYGSTLSIYNDGNPHIESLGAQTLWINQRVAAPVNMNGGGGSLAVGGPTTINNNLTVTGTGYIANIDTSGWMYGFAQSSYGTLGLLGSRNGWNGITFNDNAGTEAGTFMVSTGSNTPTTGFYNAPTGVWQWGFTGGTMSWGNIPERFLSQPNQSLSTTGYRVLPGGMIMQWTQMTALNTWTFPIPFPNACLSVSVTPLNVDGSAAYSGGVNNLTTTSCYVNGVYSNPGNYGSAGITTCVIAIGY